MSFSRRRFPSDLNFRTRTACAVRVALAFACIAAPGVRADRLTLDPAAPLVSVVSDGRGTVVESPYGVYSALRLSGGHIELFDARPVPYPGKAGDIIPHGVVAVEGTARAAWLGGATARYAHGILGDRIEASRLYVASWNAAAAPIFLELGPEAVFEDLQPRFADLDGDGQSEILVVKSYLAGGAAVAAFRTREGRLETVAETAPVGQPNRWLNPVGVADFDGDGRPELAVVITPHIGGILTFYRLENGAFRRLAMLPGVSNHVIGSRILGQSAIADFNGDGVPDIAVPGSDGRSLRLISFAGGRPAEIGRIAAGGRVTGAVGAADIDGNGRLDLVFGLDGRLVVELR